MKVMSSIEEKLKELKHLPYKGMRPEDFEEFWLQSLHKDAPREATLDLERIPYPISKVEVYNASLQAGDGVALKGYYLRPSLNTLNKPAQAEANKGLPGLVRFHGYSGNRGQISELLFWALQGYAVLALDIRGQGGETPDSRIYPSGAAGGWMTLGLETLHTYYYHQVYLDAVRMVEALAKQPEVDPKRLGCIGKSQGGGLAIVAAGLNNHFGRELDLKGRVTAITAAMPFLADFRRAYEFQSGGPLEELIGYFQLKDPQHKREEKIFASLDYFDAVNFAPWLGNETSCLVAMGLKDTVCPPPSVYALYQALGRKKELLVYPESGHEMPDEYVDEQLEFLARKLELSK